MDDLRRKRKEKRKRKILIFFLFFIIPTLVLMGIFIAILDRIIIDIDAADSRSDETPKEILMRILRGGEAVTDSVRGTKATGGEFLWDKIFFYLTCCVDFIFAGWGIVRKTKYLTKIEIAKRRAKGQYVEEIEEGEDDNESKILCYLESKKFFLLKRTCKLLLGITLVTLACYLKPYFLNISDNRFLHGMTQAIFSYLFVSGMLLFAAVAKVTIEDAEKKMFDKRKENSKTRIFFYIVLFTGTVLLAGYLNIIVAKIHDVDKNKAGHIIHFYTGGFLSGGFIGGIIVLIGAAVFGRILIEKLLKKSTIRFFFRYNLLLGSGAKDKFTNNAINRNELLSYGYLEGSEDILRIAVPDGYKIKLRNGKFLNKLLVSYKDLSIKSKKIYAYDADGNCYETEEGSRKNNKLRQILKLLALMLFFYFITLLGYASNYILGITGTALIDLRVHNQDLANFLYTSSDSLTYVIAILAGVQAAELCFKLMSIFATDNTFLDKFHEKLEKGQRCDNDDKKELRSYQRWFEIKKRISIACTWVLTGGFITFVSLLATDKVKLNNHIICGILFIFIILYKVFIGAALGYYKKGETIEKFIDKNPSAKLIEDDITTVDHKHATT